MKRFRKTGLIALSFFALTLPVGAHPEFQLFSQTHSGRNVNCSMCHAHPDGPEGVKPGQVGSLSPAQLELLGRARAAFEPGQSVNSPILNEFGNSMVSLLGKRKILEVRAHPEALGDLLGTTSDLDGDGILDADEFMQGTHPLEAWHGDPWALFKHNLWERGFHVVMLAVATVLGLYGLNHLLRWFAGVTDRWAETEELDG